MAFLRRKFSQILDVFKRTERQNAYLMRTVFAEDPLTLVVYYSVGKGVCHEWFASRWVIARLHRDALEVETPMQMHLNSDDQLGTTSDLGCSEWGDRQIQSRLNRDRTGPLQTGEGHGQLRAVVIL